MEAILPVAFLILCGMAFFSHRVCPKGIEWAALTLMTVATLAVIFILFAPKEYMLHIPESLKTILHPWILGLFALVSGTLGVSGLIGSIADRIVSAKTNEA